MLSRGRERVRRNGHVAQRRVRRTVEVEAASPGGTARHVVSDHINVRESCHQRRLQLNGAGGLANRDRRVSGKDRVRHVHRRPVINVERGRKGRASVEDVFSDIKVEKSTGGCRQVHSRPVRGVGDPRECKGVFVDDESNPTRGVRGGDNACASADGVREHGAGHGPEIAGDIDVLELNVRAGEAKADAQQVREVAGVASVRGVVKDIDVRPGSSSVVDVCADAIDIRRAGRGGRRLVVADGDVRQRCFAHEVHPGAQAVRDRAARVFRDEKVVQRRVIGRHIQPGTEAGLPARQREPSECGLDRRVVYRQRATSTARIDRRGRTAGPLKRDGVSTKIDHFVVGRRCDTDGFPI